MKLRVDLLKHLTEQDILEEVLANNHRYQAEPLFARTGVGSLRPASPEERLHEIERCQTLIQRLIERAQSADELP